MLEVSKIVYFVFLAFSVVRGVIYLKVNASIGEDVTIPFTWNSSVEAVQAMVISSQNFSKSHVQADTSCNDLKHHGGQMNLACYNNKSTIECKSQVNENESQLYGRMDIQCNLRQDCSWTTSNLRQHDFSLVFVLCARDGLLTYQVRLIAYLWMKGITTTAVVPINLHSTYTTTIDNLSTRTNTKKSTKKTDVLSDGEVAGIVIGCLIAFFVAIVLVFRYCKNRKSKRKPKPVVV